MSPPKGKSISATLIVNPVSGKGDPIDRRKSLQKVAKSLGWIGTYRETTKDLNATTIAKEEVKKGAKHIIACGGDGTIMEVLDAVINKNITLGIIPLGTANILARNLNLPLEMDDAMKVALLGNNFQMDVGRANGTYFTLVAGIGLDAEVMRVADRKLKNRWGFFAYILSVIKNITNRSGKYEVTLDNKKPFTIRAKTIMASNMGRLMGGLEVVPLTDPQSGTLRLGIVKSKNLAMWIDLFSNALRGKVHKSPHYDVHQAQKITIRVLSGKKYYECDGEHFPPTDVLKISILPKALTVMVNPDVIDDADSAKKNVLLFDFDGTLADTLYLMMDVYNVLAKKHNYTQITQKDLEKMKGLSARQVIAQLPVAKIKIPFLFAEGKKEFESRFELTKPFPEMNKAITLLSKKYTLGIVTSNDPANVKKFLINQNIDYFEFIYSDGSLFGKGKILKKAIKEYEFDTKNIIYIGDEVRDIEAAREAGIRVASVTWGFNSKKVLTQNSPDLIIDSPMELTSRKLFTS